MSIKRNKQHKPCKSEKLHNKRVVYEDFLGESRGKKLIYCERCCQWMAPPGIHTCSEPPKPPKTWGKMRKVKPRKDVWIQRWKRWIDKENRAAKHKDITKQVGR